jgi:deoxyribose-phosphate aldolase
MSASIAALIDHTLLKPDASAEEIGQLCAEARKYGFAAVCVNPCWVKSAAAELDGSEVKVCTVVGFPLGANSTETKVFETNLALGDGAREIDMVISIGELKGQNEAAVGADIRAVVQAAHAGGAIVKVILETALLRDSEKIAASRIANTAGADFVKTSTGFGPGGATAEDVALLRQTVGSQMGVKASGGIRSLQDLRKMVAAGASRIGASSSVRIMTEAAAEAAA